MRERQDEEEGEREEGEEEEEIELNLVKEVWQGKSKWKMAAVYLLGSSCYCCTCSSAFLIFFLCRDADAQEKRREEEE